MRWEKTVLASGATYQRLIEQARSRDPADRERLLMGLAELGAEGAETLKAPDVQDVLSSIFMHLVLEAERDIRQRLAEKLAEADWAPPALINVLALDEIEIARPIIRCSPVLKDHDLVRLLVEATVEHQIEIARRPMLGGVVVAAILHQAEPAVLTALASNTSAEISDHDMRFLVEQAQTVAGLRSPLSRHPRLRAELAESLYLWVGQSLRRSLAERFRLDANKLDLALADAVGEAFGGVAHDREGLRIVAREGERLEMERKLVEKLHAAGELRASYLIRALREGRLSLFCAALAKLGGFQSDQILQAIESDRPELLGLACVAVGIDRGAFPSILERVRQLNGGRPGGAWQTPVNAGPAMPARAAAGAG